MAKSKETEPPKLTTIIILGVLSLLLGKSLAFISLATQPVNEVNAMPKAEDRVPGVVYYVRGSESAVGGWDLKRQALLDGKRGMTAFDENELNQWSRREVVIEKDPEATVGIFSVDANGLNFRLLEDRIQIATRVELPGLMQGKQFILQYEGHFESTDDGPKLVIDHGSFGRAPIGEVPIIRELFGRFMFSEYMKTEEYQTLLEVYNTLDEVLIENGRIGFVRS